MYVCMFVYLFIQYAENIYTLVRLSADLASPHLPIYNIYNYIIYIYIILYNTHCRTRLSSELAFLPANSKKKITRRLTASNSSGIFLI